MAVSMGFLRKIQQWAVDEYSGELLFLPFQVNGNPYKAKVLLAGTYPEPLLEVDASDFEILAETLVDPTLFNDLFREQIADASREYKGSLNLMSWVKENLNEQVVLSSINCLNLDSEQLKQMKKEKDPLYLKGVEIFKEVINEFEPEILIIQGSNAYKHFLEIFKEQLIEYETSDLHAPVQMLEKNGTVAKMRLNSGRNVNIVVCRSMGVFGREGKSFSEFKDKLTQLLD